MMTTEIGGTDGIIGEWGGSAMYVTSQRQENSRLSCHIKPERKIDGIVVHISKKQA